MKRILTVLLALTSVQCCSAIELETYTSKGNPRTLGVDFSIGRPKEWMTRDAMPPGTLAVFWKAPTGLVDNMTLIFPRSPSSEANDVTKEDFRGTFENPQLEHLFGRALGNAKFLGKKLLEDYKYPAGYLEYSARYKLATGETVMKIRIYVVSLGNVMMQIQFFLVQDGNDDPLKQFDGAMTQILATLQYTPR